MRVQQVLSVSLGLYFCIYAKPYHPYHLNAYGWGGGHRHRFESECDPGWRCVGHRDCYGDIKPWFAPKSRCGRQNALVCCGPEAAPAAAPRRPEPPRSQVHSSTGSEAISPSEIESDCDPGWRCVAEQDCQGATKPWFAPKSLCGRDRGFVCCGSLSRKGTTTVPNNRQPVPAKAPAKVPAKGPPKAPTKSQVHSSEGEEGMSPSERACSTYSRLSFMVNSVVGGKEAKIYDFPYMVAIGYSRRGRQTSNLFWNCGGTIISDRFVLTAAHCITDAREMALEPTALRAGSAHVPERGPLTPSDRAVTQVTLHPDHRPPIRSHDLALLRADPPLKFSASVRPACLPSPAHTGTVEKEHAELWAAGWGATNRHGTRKSTQLKKTKLNVVSLDTCKQLYASAGSVPEELDENILCAAHPTRQSDTCSGDSGGPLLSPPGKRGSRGAVVVAVTSFGGVPCADVQPGVYARTAPALRWIESVVWP